MAKIKTARNVREHSDKKYFDEKIPYHKDHIMSLEMKHHELEMLDMNACFFVNIISCSQREDTFHLMTCAVLRNSWPLPKDTLPGSFFQKNGTGSRGTLSNLVISSSIRDVKDGTMYHGKIKQTNANIVHDGTWVGNRCDMSGGVVLSAISLPLRSLTPNKGNRNEAIGVTGNIYLTGRNIEFPLMMLSQRAILSVPFRPGLLLSDNKGMSSWPCGFANKERVYKDRATAMLDMIQCKGLH